MLRADLIPLQFRNSTPDTAMGWNQSGAPINLGVFTPATAMANGSVGLVPKPLSGQQDYILSNNGWIVAPTGGGGASPAGIDTEIQIKAGSVFGVGKVFIPSDGNIELGANTLAGAVRTIIARGLAANVGLELHGKGTSGVKLVADSVVAAASYLLINKPSSGGGITGLQYVTNVAPMVSVFDFRGTAQNDIFTLQFQADKISLSSGTLIASVTSKPFVISGSAGAGSKPPSDIKLMGGESGTSSIAGGNAFLLGGDNSVPGAGIGGNVTVMSGNGNDSDGNVIIDSRRGLMTIKAQNAIVFSQGTNAVNGGPYLVITKRTSSFPISSGTNVVIYAQASSDGLSALSLYPEQTVEAVGVYTATSKVKIQYRGVWYYVALQAV